MDGQHGLNHSAAHLDRGNYETAFNNPHSDSICSLTISKRPIFAAYHTSFLSNNASGFAVQLSHFICHNAPVHPHSMCANSRRRNIVQIIVTIKTYGRNKFQPLRVEQEGEEKNCWNGYAEQKLWLEIAKWKKFNRQRRNFFNHARARGKLFNWKTCEWWFPL